jgi:hypothetical protein
VSASSFWSRSSVCSHRDFVQGSVAVADFVSTHEPVRSCDLLREHTVWSSFFLFCCRSWVSPCAARGPTGSSDFSVRGPLLRFRLILGRACSRCGSHRPRFSVLLCVQHTAPGERSVQQWSRYRSLLLIWFPRQDFVLPPGSQLLGFGFWFARPGRSRLF